MMRSYHPENSRTHQNTQAGLGLSSTHVGGESQVKHRPFAPVILAFGSRINLCLQAVKSHLHQIRLGSDMRNILISLRTWAGQLQRV